MREIAAATDLRENYVRWLFQQVYRKLGVSGQVALVRQVLAADAFPRRCRRTGASPPEVALSPRFRALDTFNFEGFFGLRVPLETSSILGSWALRAAVAWPRRCSWPLSWSARGKCDMAEGGNDWTPIGVPTDRVGVVQLDRAGHVLEANAPALEILRRGDGLIDRDGVLDAWLPADRSRLRRLLARALPDVCGEAPSGGSMSVQRSSGRSRLGVHVSPVGDGKRDFGGQRVAVLVLVVDPTSESRVDPTRVATLLGLTPSESRVSALLAEGLSVREIAAATDLRESYVRWLFQQVYKKLGVSGQVALVRQVLAADALPWR